MVMAWLPTTFKVRDWLRAHPNEDIVLQRVIEETGLTDNVVSGAVETLLRNHKELTRISRGVYRWTSKSTPASRRAQPPVNTDSLKPGSLVEVIGQDANGVPLGRDENDVIRRLVAL